MAVSLLACAYSHAATPVVSNVRASQRAGTKLVDILYDVSDADGDPLTITVAVSTNGGASYNLPVRSFSGSGYGTGVTQGNDKQIVWNAGLDWNGQFSTDVRVRVAPSDVSGPGIVPPGTFQMGDGLLDNWTVEIPVHGVYVSGFVMDQFLVTEALWRDVHTWATNNGYSFDNYGGFLNGTDYSLGTNYPVQYVSWYDVVKWCNARSQKAGLTPCYYGNTSQTIVYRTGQAPLSPYNVKWTANGYRLPTEAEWEKAARGGLIGKRFPWGDTITHTKANYESRTIFFMTLAQRATTIPTT